MNSSKMATVGLGQECYIQITTVESRQGAKECQTPNVPVPNVPVRMYLPEDIPQ